MIIYNILYRYNERDVAIIMEKISIGKKTYSKKQLTEQCRKILYRYEIGQMLDNEDSNFMTEVFKRHHNAKKKIGCGIQNIRIIDQPPHRAFEIIRVDESSTDISYVKCINMKKERYDFKEACRNAVKEDINEFKKSEFEKKQDEHKRMTCPETGEKISYENSHVDHEAPNTFEKIVNDWIEMEKIEPNNIKIKGYDDGEIGKEFEDEKVRQSFRLFHQKQAKLRITSPKGNLSLSRKQANRLKSQ